VVSYLLDTGWIVRHLRGHQADTESISRLAPDGLAVSIISVAELQEGVSLAKDRERAARSLTTFLTSVAILLVEEETCRIFGELSLPRCTRKGTIPAISIR
jgi:tRNA(fMet)-specific endonuclease VapC